MMPVLPVLPTAALARYQQALVGAPLAPASRGEYVTRVRGFLAWLDPADVPGPASSSAASTATCTSRRCVPRSNGMSAPPMSDPTPTLTVSAA